jgi:hypothetical protein
VTSAAASLEGLLVDERLVSDTAVRQARRVALRRRVSLLEVLVDEHAVEEEQVASALCRRLGLPRLRLGSVTLDEEALREVPHDLASAHLVVPTRLDLGSERRTIQLAMANPLDAGAIEDVAHASGSHLELGVSTLGEIREAIQRSYRGLITKMIPRLQDQGSDPAVPGPGEPTTAPHLQLPDERSVEVRLRALVDLLMDKGLFSQAELDDRVRRLVRGEDV